MPLAADLPGVTAPEPGSPVTTADGLGGWLRGLSGCPQVTDTAVLECRSARHDGQAERPTWFFCEADAAHGVARVRCVACGQARGLLDSDAHWTYPPMHACPGCAQSMVEVAVGVHAEPDRAVTWAVVAVRCVACGRVDGMTDLHVPRLPLDEVLATL